MKTKTHIFFLFLSIICCLSSCKNVKQHSSTGITVISLAPSITKIICQLDKMNNLVGVTDFCYFDATFDAKINSGSITRVCGFNSFNFERLLAIQPDFIFYLDSITLEDKNKLDKQFKGTNTTLVGMFHPENIEQIKQQYIQIAQYLNATENANKIIAQMDEKIAQIKPLPTIYKVLPEIYNPPFTTVGENTYIADIIRHAGAELAISSQTNWPVIPLETLVKTQIDVIISPNKNVTDKNLLLIDAYKNKRVFSPSNNDVFMQPTLDCIDICIELNDYLYKMIKKDMCF